MPDVQAKSPEPLLILESSRSAVVLQIHERLDMALGPQNWWPAQTRDEVVIGAILTQNTAWTNVERAIRRLKEAGCLTIAAIRHMSPAALAELIKPSGTYRVKAARLKTLASWLHEAHGGDWDEFFGLGLPRARQELLAVKGVGPETADAILLYAGGLATFVVDAYTQRILRRHFLTAPRASYEHTKELLEAALLQEAPPFNQLHALFVELGKRHCRTKARCDGCPLEDLPHDANA